MQIAAFPDNEPARVAALRNYSILDTEDELEYDDITHLASVICGTPIALVSLVDSHRQWFKSKVGLDVSEAPRELAFCAHAILGDTIFEIPDACDDPRFHDNPLVTGAPFIRFYAGAPLITASGMALGTLCAVDHEPRKLTDEQRHCLGRLARQVVRQLEYRLAARHLQESEAELHDVMNDTSDLIQRVGADGAILYANRAWHETLGYTEEERIKLNIFDLIHPEGMAHCKTLFERLMEGETVGITEVVLARKDGEPITLEGSLSTHFEAGRAVSTLGIFRDVSEQRAAERELLKLNATLNAVIDNVPQLIFWKDLDSVFLGCNTDFARSVGLQQASMIVGKNDFDLPGTADKVQAHRLADQRVMKSGVPEQNVEETRPNAQGMVRLLKVNRIPMRDHAGRVVGILGSCQDITDQKKYEDSLLEGAKTAERANQSKSDFLSRMSHELRTPMNAILGFAQMLENDSGLNVDQQDNTQEILKGGRHLLKLIDEVLDLAKIESGRLEISLEPVNLLSVVEDCRDLIQQMVDARQIALRLDVPFDAMVRADRTRLKQVLLNLLSNAVKYNREGGDISLGVQAAAGECWRVSISDTGHGIAPERMPELFQPFNRLDAQNSDTEGTGIGLSITRQLVELMNGRINAESQVRVGSTFWFELPRETESIFHGESPTQVKPIEPQTNGPIGKYRVLCVDDNPVNLKLINQILGKRQNISLILANEPELGIELAVTHRPNLILLDINMPGMDGYEVLTVIKADTRLKNIPVFAVTANAMPRDIERGLSAGFNEYMTKPLNVGAFLKIVDQYLSLSERANDLVDKVKSQG